MHIKTQHKVMHIKTQHIKANLRYSKGRFKVGNEVLQLFRGLEEQITDKPLKGYPGKFRTEPSGVGLPASDTGVQSSGLRLAAGIQVPGSQSEKNHCCCWWHHTHLSLTLTSHN